MPMYDYKCEKCGKIHTELRKMSDRGNESICECGGNCTITLGATAMSYTINDKKNVPSWVKEKFRELRKTHKNSNLTNY